MKFLKNKFKYFVAAAVLIITGTQSSFAITSSQLENYRIRIHTTTTSTTLRIRDGYELSIDGVKTLQSFSSNGDEIVFTKSGDKVVVKNSSGTNIGTGNEITINKKDDAVRYFEVKGIDNTSYAKYPDNVTIRLDSTKSNLLVINVTPLENYLKGVIPYEMGANAPLEAMKAQAITARSLAVKRINNSDKDGYDVTNTTSDQVYKGYNATYFASTHNVSKAVKQTKGVVLTYNGSIIEGLYYSNNGGQTASDGFVWGSGNSTPYYVSKADPYDTYLHSTSVNWGKISYSESYTKQELRDIILDSSVKYPGYFKTPYCTPSFDGISENYEIEVLNKSNGYVTQIKLSDDTGRSYIIKNYANRWFFGLRSQQYKLTKTGGVYIASSSKTTEANDVVYVLDGKGNVNKVEKENLVIQSATSVTVGGGDVRYVFTGQGYGHGIGMSQNGAMNRADSGQTYSEILSFYYDGAKIVSNYGN